MMDQFITKCFAKGKEKEKAGHYDAAFSFYEVANRAKFKNLKWDEAVEDDLHQEIINTFTAEYIEHHSLKITGRITPVFIVGMPRSGSTLIEQILDTHPDIHGTGEVPYIANAIINEFKEPYIYPDDLPDLGRIGLWKMRKQYLADMERDAQGKEIICDKMLLNFLHIGLIAILFPNAKIIHSARNREDCLTSCYAKQFKDENLPFTYNRAALVNYHRRYEEMMRHWDKVMPGRIRTVQHESMVHEHEKTVAELLEFVGVEYDRICLKFYDNPREVKTASRDQVNKPIYTSSIGRGNHFVKYFSG